MEYIKTSKTNVHFERNRYADAHKGIAILMVVGIHSIGYSTGICETHQNILHNIIFGVAVTSFFFIDGFLFCLHHLNNINLNFLKFTLKNCIRLLKPWLIFSLTYSIFRLLFELYFPTDEYYIIGVSYYRTILNIFNSTFIPQTYFLLSLFTIRTISYPIIQLLKSNAIFFCIGIFCCILAFRFFSSQLPQEFHVPNGQNPITHAVWGAQFYFAGSFVGFFYNNLKTKALLISEISLSLLIISLFLNDFLLFRYCFRYSYIFLLFFGFHLVSGKCFLLEIIGYNSMGIYLLHAPVLIRIVSFIIIKYSISGWLSFLIVFLSVSTISFFISQIMRNNILFQWITGVK